MFAFVLRSVEMHLYHLYRQDTCCYFLENLTELLVSNPSLPVPVPPLVHVQCSLEFGVEGSAILAPRINYEGSVLRKKTKASRTLTF